MRILIHDFAGHPFQAQLSRELARQGHTVLHVYLCNLEGPKGRLAKCSSDSPLLDICGIRLNKSFKKYAPIRRFISHREYAGRLKRILGERKFDVVLSGNTPIDIQAELLWYCRKRQIGFVHWVQDVYCRAIEFFLRRKFSAAGAYLALPFEKLERAVAMHSDATVVIAPAFKELLTRWGVLDSKVTVIENWAPLEEIHSLPRSNGWSEQHDLNGKTVFLYSGTLGLKHRPDLLYKLAESLDHSSRLVVISEGVGREYLKKKPALDTLQLLDFQPFHALPSVLASADVLIATLEKDAGDFAVPSKVLTYLCAGRAILLGAPSQNLASEIVRRSEGGLVADPDREQEWFAQAGRLAADSELRRSLGISGRLYAEENFNVTVIAKVFEDVLLRACSRYKLFDSNAEINIHAEGETPRASQVD